MRRAAPIVVALIVLILVVVGGVEWLGRDLGDDMLRDDAVDAPVAAAPVRDVRRRDVPAKADVDSVSSDAIPSPVDFATVDRDRDLHGVVVRRDGTPVAGAELVAFVHPWRRTDFLNAKDMDTVVDGAKTRSASDGSFAIRLRRGARVQLRVTADGLAPLTLRERQAGERVRIVMDAGVRLRVTVVDAENRLLPNVKLRLVSSYGERLKTADVDREVVSGPDGDAVCDGLPPNTRLHIELLFGGCGYATAYVALGDSGETTYRLDVPTGRTLRGRVVDDATGLPIPKASVGRSWMLDHAVTTDADGRFELLGWSDRGHPEIGSAADGYARAVVNVGDGAEFEVRLHRGFEASGRIVDGEGRPVRGALLELIGAVFESAAKDLQQTSTGDAVSDADGRFRVTGLNPAIAHEIVVVAEGFGRLRRMATTKRDTIAALDLGDVVLPPARLVAGRVLDGAGQPAPRVPVTLDGPSLPPLSDLERINYGEEEEAVTDDLGRFAFGDIAPGDYEVRADVPGAGVVKASVAVPPDRDVDGVQLAVAGGRRITVHVVDEKGDGVAGARVFVFAAGRRDQLDASTDDHGVARFESPDAPAESLLVDLPSQRVTLDHKSFRYVPPDGEVRFVVCDGAAVAGVVLDPDGKAVSGAKLRFVFADGTNDSAEASDAGRFDEALPKGSSVRVTVEGAKYDGDPAHFDAAQALVGSADVVPPASDIVIRCERVAVDRKLTVKLTTPDGDPVAGAEVHIKNLARDGLKTETTDAQGLARFEGLPARELRVSAYATAKWARAVDTAVTPAGQQIVVALRRAAEIRGVVVDADGNPAFVNVEALAPDDDWAEARPGHDGRFVLVVPADRPGPYWIRAGGSGSSRSGERQGVLPGDDLRIVLSK